MSIPVFPPASPPYRLNVPTFPPVSTTAPTPPSAGLAAWYKADAGVTKSGTDVTAWADQSGNGINLTVGSGVSPVFVASAINGLPGFDFNLATRYLTSGGVNPLAAGADRTVSAVVLPKAGSGSGVFDVGGTVCTFKSGASGVWIGYCATLGGSTYGYSSGVTSDTIASPPTLVNVPTCFQLGGIVGSLPVFTINGVDYAPSGGHTVATDDGADSFLVGNEPNFAATQWFAGYLCELLVHDHVLTGPEQAQLAAYVTSRYAIAM